MNILSVKELLTFSFILFICVNLISCGNEKKPDTQNNIETPATDTNKKSVESSNNFIAVYDLKGMVNGTMTIYKSGNNLRQKIDTEIMGMKNSSNIYIVNGVVYNVNEIGDKKSGNKTNLKEYNASKQTGETITDFREFEKFISGKKVVGTENILGFNCDIYDMGSGITISVFNKKYILKIKNAGFMAVATNLDMNPVIDSNEFQIPKDVDFKSSDPSKIKKEILDSLVDNLKK